MQVQFLMLCIKERIYGMIFHGFLIKGADSLQ